MSKFEYYLKYWGEAEPVVKRTLQTKCKDFWFNTERERAKFRRKLESIADKYRMTIVFIEEEGTGVRLRTVARMIMCLPNGKEYPFKYDFGFAYEKSSAEFMFIDRNYSCDCNKSLFLSEIFKDVEEGDCGHDIKLKNFVVTLE